MLRLKIAWPLALAVGCLIPSARAEVTLSQQDVSGVNCWVFENQFLQVAIRTDNGRLLGIVKKTDPGAGQNQVQPAYPSYLTRVGQDTVTVSSFTEGGDASKRTLTVTAAVLANAGSATVNFETTQLYSLADNSKTFCADLTFKNTDAAVDWVQDSPLDGLESIMYVAPGGTAPAGDEIQVKTANGVDAATSGTNYWGTPAPGLTARPELVEGWFAGVDAADPDPANAIVVAVTWPIAVQQAHKTGEMTTLRMYTGSNRFQMHPIFNNVKAGETLNYQQCITVDSGIPMVSYAAPESLIAGVSLNSSSFSQGATITATFRMNSVNPTQAASYDLKNIRLINPEGQSVATAAAATNVALGSNEHISLTRQLQIPASAPEGAYVVAADLYPAGGATPMTTLFSRSTLVTPANVKVLLLQDSVSGNWILENEVIRTLINVKGEVVEFSLKTAENRNQVNPSYALFRDYVKPLGTNIGFNDYIAVADPSGTDTPEKKSIAFQQAYNTHGDVSKVFTLESMSRSLQNDMTFVSALPDPLTGQGFFSHVAMAPGGGGNAADQFTARAGETLITHHVSNNRTWIGAEAKADGTAVVAANPALTEGWMAVADTVVTDAMALTWNLAQQQTFSLTPTDGTTPVTMSSVFSATGFNRHILEPHYTNVPAGGTVQTTQYVMGDTGFELIGYAEGKRVMAGVWSEQAEVAQGNVLSAAAAITNTGTTSRTFELRQIRAKVVGGTDTLPGPADITGIVLNPAERANRAISLSIPGAQPEGSLVVMADLYEGGTRIATLESLPFAVIVPSNGDVDGSGTVDLQDAVRALSIWGGLTAGDPGNISRGNLAPDTAGLTLEDAAAIARKVANL